MPPERLSETEERMGVGDVTTDERDDHVRAEGAMVDGAAVDVERGTSILLILVAAGADSDLE